MIGNPISASLSFITTLVCHAALSSRIVDSSLQEADSRSSYLANELRNRVITSVSVVAWVNAHHILPSVSRAVCKEIHGATYLSVMVAAASVGAQILRRKRVPFSQLSSTLITRQPDSKSGNIRRAYCYRSTKQRGRLPYTGTVLASR